MEVFIMQNIIFGIMVLIAVGAGVVTCIYEAGGSSHHSSREHAAAEQTIEKNN